MSTVMLPLALADGLGGNPAEERGRVIESACFRRALDNWIVNKREEDRNYWDSYSI